MTDKEYYDKIEEAKSLRAKADEIMASLKEETDRRTDAARKHLESVRPLIRSWKVKAAYWVCRAVWTDPSDPTEEKHYAWGIHYRITGGRDYTIWLADGDSEEDIGSAPPPGCRIIDCWRTAGGDVTNLRDDSYEAALENLGVRFLSQLPNLQVLPSRVPAMFEPGYYGGANLNREP